MLSYPPPRFTREYDSGLVAAAVDTIVSFAHGLGVVPRFVVVEMHCGAANLGYEIGDVVELAPHAVPAATAGFSVRKSASAVDLVFAEKLQLVNATTNVAGDITAASWSYRVRAYA